MDTSDWPMLSLPSESLYASGPKERRSGGCRKDDIRWRPIR